MKIDELLKEYKAKLKKEALLKSFVIGGLIAFGVLFTAAFAFWFFGVKEFWISFVLFGVALGAAVPAFYFLKFKPTDAQVARRVDALGLEERVVTMNEFSGKEDFIYEKQREDAVSAVGKVSATLLKIAMPIVLLVLLPIAFVISSGMTTVSVLSSLGVISSGSKIIEQSEREKNKKYYEITYETDGEGMVLGDVVQLVEEGFDATPVIAEADDGWVFVYWSDGNENPSRQELKVVDRKTIVAVFQQTEEGDGEGEGEGEGDESGDQPGDGQGQKGESEGEGNNPGAGGKYEPSNQIIDGETYYGDNFSNYYTEVNDGLSQDGSTGSEDKGYIDDYFKSIAR